MALLPNYLFCSCWEFDHRSYCVPKVVYYTYERRAIQNVYLYIRLHPILSPQANDGSQVCRSRAPSRPHSPSTDTSLPLSGHSLSPTHLRLILIYQLKEDDETVVAMPRTMANTTTMSWLAVEVFRATAVEDAKFSLLRSARKCFYSTLSSPSRSLSA